MASQLISQEDPATVVIGSAIVNSRTSATMPWLGLMRKTIVIFLRAKTYSIEIVLGVVLIL